MLPDAARRGHYVFSSTLDGADMLGVLDPRADVQIRLALERLRRVLEEQGAAATDVVGLSAHVADWSLREPVLAAVRKIFESDAFVRVIPMPLPPGTLVEVQAIACVGSAEGGRAFMTSAIGARRRNGALPADVRDEIASALEEVCERVTAAGGSPDELVHVWAFAREGIGAEDFTPSWLARFPNEGDRPARKTWMRLAGPFGDERVVFQATAVIGGGPRSNYEVFGVRHREPLPLGTRVGPLFMSSGIPSNAPHESDPAGLGPIPGTLQEHFDNAFASLTRLMRDQNGTLENVGLLGALLGDPADLPALRSEILGRWPADRLPALQLWSLPPTNPQQRVQLFASAVL
jgi:enamine deaminase RidA (YjgF/YER057c/UK114 family)